MKTRQFLIAAMLVIMGERWEYSHQEGIQTCQGMPQRCSGGEPHYRRVYVIGKIPWYFPGGTSLDLGSLEPVEVFTIPVPNVPVKAMTKEEAEKANRGIK